MTIESAGTSPTGVSVGLGWPPVADEVSTATSVPVDAEPMPGDRVGLGWTS